jgi:hypothetical protein
LELFKLSEIMKRRNLLKSLSIGATSIITLPNWASGWNQNSLEKSNHFTASEDELLGEIMEIFIPETNTPGAKELAVHKLIQKIVVDCYGKESAEKLSSNLLIFNNLSKGQTGADFIKLSADNRLAFLKTIEKSDNNGMAEFYKQLKQMTIEGYMKSEWAMVNIQKYEWAPGRWKGCVSL